MDYSFSVMKKYLFVVLCFLFLSCLTAVVSFAQVENVSAYDPIYTFLKRMELKGIIENYHSAIIPLSRGEIAGFLKTIDSKSADLTSVDRDNLAKYLIEYQFDITGSTDEFHQVLNFSNQTVGESFMQIFSDKEKFLYAYNDSTLSFFIDGLLTVDLRKSVGDALGNDHAEFTRFGGRIRGTIHNSFGYYIDGTNAQFYGSRTVLRRDRLLSQDYTLGVGDAQNFDHIESYIRYESSPISVELGRERLFWGTGYGDKTILSDNVRPFDAIRFDAQYKLLKYTFMHGWLLGNRSYLQYSLPSDTSTKFTEPIDDDKYIVAHRLEVSIPHAVDIGFNEMMVYSNRAPDLAYLNPIQLLESTQRNRDERDNGFWVFDMRVHWISGWEIQGSALFDDLNFPKWGTNDVQNKAALQAGILGVDPFGIPLTNIAVEYTRIDPYTFSHNRSRDNNYSSGGNILSHHIGPNSDSWFCKLENFWSRRLTTSVSYENVRHGNNIVSPGGQLVFNVGGDIFQPWRPVDSQYKNFLGGNFQRIQYINVAASYELYRQMFLEGWYRLEHTDNVTLGFVSETKDFGMDLRMDF
jgi:hypothetical protein